jgi:hypothetical protein
VRFDKTNALVVQDGNSRYQEATLRNQLFVASTQAGVALSLLSATATGFILTNPAGSGKILIPIELLIALASAPAGIASVYVAANVNPVAVPVVHTTPLSVRPTLLGSGATAVGLADSAATLPATPVVVRAVPGGPVATGSVNAAFMKDEIAGALGLLPGTAISVQALTTAISAIISMTWAEIPILQ